MLESTARFHCRVSPLPIDQVWVVFMTENYTPQTAPNGDFSIQNDFVMRVLWTRRCLEENGLNQVGHRPIRFDTRPWESTRSTGGGLEHIQENAHTVEDHAFSVTNAADPVDITTRCRLLAPFDGDLLIVRESPFVDIHLKCDRTDKHESKKETMMTHILCLHAFDGHFGIPKLFDKCKTLEPLELNNDTLEFGAHLDITKYVNPQDFQSKDFDVAGEWVRLCVSLHRGGQLLPTDEDFQHVVCAKVFFSWWTKGGLDENTSKRSALSAATYHGLFVVGYPESGRKVSERYASGFPSVVGEYGVIEQLLADSTYPNDENDRELSRGTEMMQSIDLHAREYLRNVRRRVRGSLSTKNEPRIVNKENFVNETYESQPTLLTNSPKDVLRLLQELVIATLTLRRRTNDKPLGGVVVEFGTWRGGGGIAMAAAAREVDPNSTTWFVDSFEDISSRCGTVAFDRMPKQNTVTKESVVEAIGRFGLLASSRVERINALSDSIKWSSLPIKEVDVLRIDVSCPGAFVTVLEQLVPRMRENGVIIIDDWTRADIRAVVAAYRSSKDPSAFGPIHIMASSGAETTPLHNVSRGGKVAFWRVRKRVKNSADMTAQTITESCEVTKRMKPHSRYISLYREYRERVFERQRRQPDGGPGIHMSKRLPVIIKNLTLATAYAYHRYPFVQRAALDIDDVVVAKLATPSNVVTHRLFDDVEEYVASNFDDMIHYDVVRNKRQRHEERIADTIRASYEKGQSFKNLLVYFDLPDTGQSGKTFSRLRRSPSFYKRNSTPVMYIGKGRYRRNAHFDLVSSYIVQIVGVKRVRLFPPALFQSAACVDLDRTSTTFRQSPLTFVPEAFDSEAKSCESFSMLWSVEETLRPGDGLFIPIGWGHLMEAQTSWSVSVSHFEIPGESGDVYGDF